MKNYEPKKRIDIYADDEFRGMPAGDEIACLEADDCANVTLPTGETFNCGADGLRVRVMKAHNEEDRGLWFYGNRGGRLYL